MAMLTISKPSASSSSEGNGSHHYHSRRIQGACFCIALALAVCYPSQVRVVAFSNNFGAATTRHRKNGILRGLAREHLVQIKPCRFYRAIQSKKAGRMNLLHAANVDSQLENEQKIPTQESSTGNKTAATASPTVNGDNAISERSLEKSSRVPDQLRQQQQLVEDEEERERMKNSMLFLCWGVALLSALDRVAMSVALVPLSAEFGYTDTMKGAVSSLFSVGYGLGIVPAGILVATASPRIVMACGITLWSLATIATPHAATAYSSMIPLLLARASVGAAESAVLPTLQTLLSSWTTSDQKSRSLAIVFSGFHAGTVGAYLISPLVIEYLGGWREVFLLYGGIGLFWLIPWMLYSKDAPQPPGTVSQFNTGTVIDVSSSESSSKSYTKSTTADSSNAINDTQTETKKISEWAKSMETLRTAPWVDFAKSKGTWAMLLAHAANNWGLYNNLAWSPTFYSEQYGLNVRDSALFSILPSVAGAIGGFVAGSMSDQLLRNIDDKLDQENRDAQVTKIRKTIQGLALYGPAVALLTLSSHIPEQPWMAQYLLMGTTGMMAFNSAGYLSANQEKAGEKWAGLLYSITSLPAVMTGTFGVYLTGQILDFTHQDWSVVFALNAGINFLGATAFVALYDSKREFD